MFSRLPLDQQLVRIGQGAMGLSVCATLAGFAGPLWWALDLFAHFRPQYLVAAVLLAMLFALTRRPGWAAGAVALAVINAVPVASLYLQPAEAAFSASTPPLRLMSFNVFNHNHDYAATLQYVQRESPDVLVLIEVTPEWAAALQALTAQYP